MKRFKLLLAISVGTLVAAGGAADAQEPRFQTALSVEEVREDPDYFLLGEFVGEIAAEDGSQQALAIQVRPVGRDRFEAVAFRGGLPGQSGHDPEPMWMIGQRHQEYVVLSGSPWALFAQKDLCQVIDLNGNKLGQLHRVHRRSPTLGAKAPEQAFVIFDGQSTENFVVGELSDAGLLKQGAIIKPLFQDFDLHVEFWLPLMPAAGGQARANSGIYVHSRYECQMLDSFAQSRQFDGLGAIYRYREPDLNMSLPPLQWQTYDLRFTAPRWAADGSKMRDATVSVWINGVKVQDNVSLPSKTGHGEEEGVSLLPIKLQDHQNPVFYRNIWAVDRGLVGFIDFPVQASEEEQLAAAATPVVLTGESVVAEPADEPTQVQPGDEAAEEDATQESSPESEAANSTSTSTDSIEAAP